jgi:predicted acylesterase/phospholipase RssA
MIYTFYAHKAGASRSMALANLAECFYLRGLKVIVVDWDPEAPGLDSFFFEQDQGAAVEGAESADADDLPVEGALANPPKLGLIDMLTDYQRSLPSMVAAPDGTTPDSAADSPGEPAASDSVDRDQDFAAALNDRLPVLSTYLLPIDPREGDYPSGQDGALSLLPAGQLPLQDADPSARQGGAFDWGAFYASFRGKEYFDWLRQKLLQKADVVLIDARSGIDEIDGIAARQMADVVVSFSAPDSGVEEGIAENVVFFRRPEMAAAPEQASPESAGPGDDADRAGFDDAVDRENRITRPYDDSAPSAAPFRELELRRWEAHGRYPLTQSFGGERVIGGHAAGADPSGELEIAYWELARHLALLAPEDHPVQRRLVSRVEQEAPAPWPEAFASPLGVEIPIDTDSTEGPTAEALAPPEEVADVAPEKADVEPLERAEPEPLAADGPPREDGAPGQDISPVADKRARRREPSREDLDRAKQILAGRTMGFDELVVLAERLQDSRSFSYARQLWSRARLLPEAAAQASSFAQEHAECTYRDPELPVMDRVERALAILNEVDDLETTRIQRTLGLAGAILLARWKASGARRDLERSLAYYLRGYAQGLENDCGQTAIVAAFLLDWTAFQDERDAGTPELSTTVAERRGQARRIRQDIVKRLSDMAECPSLQRLTEDWRFSITLAEAFYALGQYEEARRWLDRARAADVDTADIESTARRLADLLLFQGGPVLAPNTPAWDALHAFVGGDVALRSVAIGKLGLALSGGGIAASLFHIGVLARLAELDALRDVEVLSCVSGGAIVGALYHLEVKRLLETKSDDDIAREDYIELVKRVEREFREGIQLNLRTRAAANPLTHWKTLLLPGYTRTERVGELLQKYLYAKAGATGLVSDVFIRPKDGSPEFDPELDNWQRSAKAPILILNATALNTGHNWQFTAKRMGEPPPFFDAQADGNELLPRVRYQDAPSEWQAMKLGRAVAASASLPGLLEPVQLRGLYPERTVRLVDGGISDRNGVGALFQQECDVFLLSDGGTQAASQEDPSPSPLEVQRRSNALLGARLRQAEHVALEARRHGAQMRALSFLHLDTDHGMLKTVQDRLAAFRADIDSFTDAEAFALMLTGYRVAKTELRVPGIASSAAAADWTFLAVERAVDRAKNFEQAHDELLKMLEESSFRGFKLWRLSPTLQYVGAATTIAVAAAIIAFWPADAALGAIALWIVGILLGALALVAMLWTSFRIVGVKKPSMQLAGALFFGTVGWALAAFHLWIVDPAFKAFGRVESRPFTGSQGKAAWIRPATALSLAALCIVGYVAFKSVREPQARHKETQQVTFALNAAPPAPSPPSGATLPAAVASTAPPGLAHPAAAPKETSPVSADRPPETAPAGSFYVRVGYGQSCSRMLNYRKQFLAGGIADAQVVRMKSGACALVLGPYSAETAERRRKEHNARHIRGFDSAVVVDGADFAERL